MLDLEEGGLKLDDGLVGFEPKELVELVVLLVPAGALVDEGPAAAVLVYVGLRDKKLVEGLDDIAVDSVAALEDRESGYVEEEEAETVKEVEAAQKGPVSGVGEKRKRPQGALKFNGPFFVGAHWA